MGQICGEPRRHQGGTWVLGLSNSEAAAYTCLSPQGPGSTQLP